MASLPPTFSIPSGLLSTQPLTPEEEYWLYTDNIFGELGSLEATGQLPPQGLMGVVGDGALPEEDFTSVVSPTDINEMQREKWIIDDDMDEEVDPLAPLPDAEPLAPPPSDAIIEDDQEPEPLIIEDEPEDRITSVKPIIDIEKEKRRLALLREQNPEFNTSIDTRDAAAATAFEQWLNDPNQGRGASIDDMKKAAAEFAELYGADSVANASDILDAYIYFNQGGKDVVRVMPDDAERITEEQAEEMGQPTAVQSLAKGTASMRQLLWAGTEAVAEVAGAEGVADTAGERRRFYGGLRAAMPEGTQLNEIESIGDALQWAKNVTLEQGALMAAPAGGAVIGGLVQRSVGAGLGAFGPSWMLGTGEVQTQNKEISEEQKAGLATLAGGSAIAALDSVLPGRIGGQLVSRLGRENAEEVAKRMLLLPMNERISQAAGQVGRETVRGMATEAVTEATQTAIGELATAIETGTEIQPDLLYRMMEAGLTGALIGGQASAVTNVATEAGGGMRADALREIESAEFTTPAEVVAAQRFNVSQGQGDVAGVPQDQAAIRAAAPPARPVVVDDDNRPDRPQPVKPTAQPVSADGAPQQFTIPDGRVTSKFGPRQQFRTQNGAMASSNHAGIDIAMPKGSAIPVGADGVIIFAGRKGGYGNQIVVQHSDGTTSSYSHLSKINVKKGQQVAQGDEIGVVGQTGNATGIHLHLERRDAEGRAVNPETARFVATRKDANDGWVDDTSFAPDKTDTVDNFWEDALAENEASAAYYEATGQQFDREAEPVQIEDDTLALTEEAPATPEPELGAESAVRDVFNRERQEEIAPAPQPEPVATEADEQASIEVPEQQEVEGAREGEEPVFASSEEGSALIGFVDTATGIMRRIDESTVPEQVEVAAAEPVAEQSQGWAPPETFEERALTDRQAAFDALPPVPQDASADTRTGRTIGRGAAMGLAEPLDAETLADQTQAFRTAYQVGLADGSNALDNAGAVEPVANSVPELATETEAVNGDNLATEVEPVVRDRVVEAPDRPASVRNSPIRIAFEVAPDPVRREEVTERWRSAGFAKQEEATRAVVETVLPRITERLRSKANVTGFMGGFMGESNPSVTISTFMRGKAVQMAKDIGFALDQDSMVLVSDQSFDGSDATDVIAVALEGADPKEIYDRLWEITVDGDHPVGGYLMNDGQMLILNFSDVDSEQLAYIIDEALDGAYEVSISDGHAAFIERGEDDYGYGGQEAAGVEGSDVNQWRAEATEIRDSIIGDEAEAVAEGQAAEEVTEGSTAKDRVTDNRGAPDNALDHPALKDRTAEKVVATLREMGLDERFDLDWEVVGTVPDNKGGKKQPNFYGRFEDRRTPDGRAHLLVKVATLAEVSPLTTVRNTVRHEVVHWAREARVFNRDEWATLERWVKSDPALMNWVDTRYRGNPNYESYSEADLIEEAVAEGFARWKGGSLRSIQISDSKIDQLFDKLARFIAAVRNAFSKNGITRGQLAEAADILNRLNTGEQVAMADVREQRVLEKTTVTFGKRKPDAFRRMVMAGKMTREQAHFARANPEVNAKDQAAWHGSPNATIEKFSTQFIGSGEGAQAYGWGLYFAENKSVAEWYRRKLSADKLVPVDEAVEAGGIQLKKVFAGQGEAIERAAYEVSDAIMEFHQTDSPRPGWLEIIHGTLENEANVFLSEAEATANDANEDPGIRAAMAMEAKEIRRTMDAIAHVIDTLSNAEVAGQEVRLTDVTGGRLYEVNVPEKELLISLDSDVANQPVRVKSALTGVKAHMDEVGVLDEYQERFGKFEEWTGYELVRRILPQLAYENAFPSEETSADLSMALVADDVPRAVSVWLRDLGIPGLRYLDRDSRIDGGNETQNFVIFDDDFVSLATAKDRVIDSGVTSPLSDPAIPNAGITGRLHHATMGLISALRGKDLDAADPLIDAFRRKVTQRYRQIQKTQARAEAMAGTRLPEGMNPMEQITADERGYKIEYLTDNMIRPMAKELAQFNLTMEDLGLYLYARHAPHRNARVAKINPEFRDPNKPGSGMTNAEAAQIIQDFTDEGKLPDLQQVATHIDSMISFAQQERLNAGLLTQEDIDAGFGPSDYYVPLRGNETLEPELEMDFSISKGGGGFSVRGKEGHRMYGRASKADLEEIVGYSITQAQEAVDRAYRNRVAQNMLAMFESFPDPKFVSIDRVKRVAVWNEKKGQVEYQMQTRMTDPDEQARTIFVKRDGETKKLTFHEGNPSAMRFVKAAKNLGSEPLGRILELTSVFTRLWSKSNTQWNLDFMLANAAKDIQTGVLNASTLDQKGLRREMVKNIASMKPLAAAWWGSNKPRGSGEGSGNVWLETYAEFEANGGKLNYGEIQPIEDAVKRARTEVKNAKRSRFNPVKLATDLFNTIDHANSAFENMTRLAAYKALRDNGVPAKRAAEAVRELTTNFAQHGEWGPKINAAYGFANASIIGGARFLKTVATNKKIVGGLILIGMMEDWLNSLWDEEKWDQYSEEEKHGNFILLTPEGVGPDVSVPAGYGLNAFITVGRKMSEMWRGKKNPDGTPMSALDAASDIGMGFVNAFAPITGNTWFNIAAPTFMDPYVDIWQNENNWGRPIQPQKSPFGLQPPDSQNAFDYTSEFWKTVAERMNEWTGGNEVEKGVIDVSPETIEHVVKETVGGAGRTVARFAELPEKVANNEVAPNDVPVARRFIRRPFGSADESSMQVSMLYSRFYEAEEIIDMAKELVGRYGRESDTYLKFRKDNERVIEFADTVADAASLMRKVKAAENAAERGPHRITGLSKRDRNAIFKLTRIRVPSDRALTDEEVAEIKEVVDEKMLSLATQFNEKYDARVMGR